MTEVFDLPALWSHEPREELMFGPGDLVSDIDANTTPGFRGGKLDAPTLQAERNIRFAELQEMLYANSRSGDTRSVLLVLQGMDTAGKGGIVKHVVGGCNPQGVQYRSFFITNQLPGASPPSALSPSYWGCPQQKSESDSAHR